MRRLVTKDRTKDRTKDSSAWAAAITRLVSGAGGAGLGSGRSDKSLHSINILQSAETRY